MNYNLEDIRFELSYSDDIAAYEDDYMSVSLLLEAVSSDIAIENKLIDTLKSGINSFKNFIKKVSNWFMYIANKSYRQGVKLKNKMNNVRNTIINILKKKKINGTATEATDNVFVEDEPYVNRTIALINEFIGIVMAQHVLAWKMMTIGAKKGRSGWRDDNTRDNWIIPILLIAGVATIAANPILGALYIPFMIMMLSARTDNGIEQNKQIEKMLINTFEEMCGTFIHYDARKRILERIKPYRNRVHIALADRDRIPSFLASDKSDNVIQVMTEVMNIKDWISYGDISVDFRPITKTAGKSIDEKKFHEYVAAAQAELHNIAIWEKEDDSDRTHESILRNMESLNYVCLAMADISLEFQHRLDDQIKSLHKQDYKNWYENKVSNFPNTMYDYYNRVEEKGRI